MNGFASQPMRDSQLVDQQHSHMSNKDIKPISHAFLAGRGSKLSMSADTTNAQAICFTPLIGCISAQLYPEATFPSSPQELLILPAKK